MHFTTALTCLAHSVEIPTTEARSCLRFQVVPSGTGQAIVVESVAEGSSAQQVAGSCRRSPVSAGNELQRELQCELQCSKRPAAVP
jgi:hypothetical protein